MFLIDFGSISGPIFAGNVDSKVLKMDAAISLISLISLACWLSFLFFYSFLLTDFYYFFFWNSCIYLYVLLFSFLSLPVLRCIIFACYSILFRILTHPTEDYLHLDHICLPLLHKGESEIININGLWRTNSAEVNVLVLVLNEHSTVLIFLKQSWRSLVLSFTYVYFSQVYHILIYKLASFRKLHSIVCFFPPLIVNGRNYQQLAN